MTGPLIGRVKDRLSEPLSKRRNKPGKRLEKRIPEVPNRNIGKGEAVGAVNAGLATILEDTLGFPFGATVDIVNVETTPQGDVYTVNVNAPTENIARARAFIDSTTGFTSYLTDEYDIEEVEVLNKRFARDTHQVTLRIQR